MTVKECVNNVGGQHVFPLDALSAVSALFEEFQDPSERVNFIRVLIDIRRAYRKRIDVEVANAWKIVMPDNKVLRDITLITNAESQQVYKAVQGVLTKSKADGGCGYCDDCATRTITYFCTPPWLKEKEGKNG